MFNINRRTIFGLLTVALLATGATPVQALDFVEYTPETLAELEASGEPYLVDFYANWCTTCQAQERVLDALALESDAYDHIAVLRVDWDVHSRSDLAVTLAIPRRSTLVLMRGEDELGRLIADPRRRQIAALLDLAGS